jgi:two-component system response regulator HydG
LALPRRYRSTRASSPRRIATSRKRFAPETSARSVLSPQRHRHSSAAVAPASDDIPILAEHFLQRIAATRAEEPKRLGLAVRDALLDYAWPGNVRELENALERSVILTEGPEIGVATLPERVTQRRAEPLVSTRTPPNPTLEAVERAYIMWVLQAENGNKSRTAEILGIDPSTLYRKLSRYGVEA